jgi:DNA-binding protein HU-beta
VNKRELIRKVAEEAAVPAKQAEAIVSAAIDAIMGAVSEGDRVTLVGFGTFEARQHKSRVGRHPQTGDALQIPAKTVPAFSAGKSFKDKVAEQLHILRVRPGTLHRMMPVETPPPEQPTLKKRIQTMTNGLLQFWK